MKTREELQQLKDEIDELNQKLAALTEEELNEVIGGRGFIPSRRCTVADTCAVKDPSQCSLNVQHKVMCPRDK